MTTILLLLAFSAYKTEQVLQELHNPFTVSIESDVKTRKEQAIQRELKKRWEEIHRRTFNEI
jgi:hypothetical protein